MNAFGEVLVHPYALREDPCHSMDKDTLGKFSRRLHLWRLHPSPLECPSDTFHLGTGQPQNRTKTEEVILGKTGESERRVLLSIGILL
jgi:hypothetical protein